MKKFPACLLAGLVLLCFSVAAVGDYQPGVTLHAEAYYLVNLDTDTVICQQNAHEVRSPASLTKMMTALLLAESGADLDTVITIPERLREEFELIQIENGSDADLRIGEEISLRDLLYCALLPSANDAASVIADYLSDGDLDAFVVQMNARARELGCTDTDFGCPHGLYEDLNGGNWSTAYDMALIARACYQNDIFMQVARTTEYWLPLSNMHSTAREYEDEETPAGMSYRIQSTNVMQDPEQPVYRAYIRGLKTGFTDLAGMCFATVASEGDEEYLLVLMGEERVRDENGTAQIYLDTAALLDWTLERFEPGALVAPGQTFVTVPLANCGDSDTAQLTPGEELTGLIDAENPAVLVTTLDSETLKAPLKAGETVGRAEVWQNGERMGEVSLQAAQDYRYSLFKQLKTFWNGLFGSEKE